MIDITFEELSSALISSFEGPPPTNAQFLYRPFQDGGGVWTIGRGHTAGVTAQTPPATQSQIDAWFAEDEAPLFELVRKLNLPVLESACYVSFGFNCGIGALQNVLAGHVVMMQYIHDAKGRVEPGLVTRRALESALIALSQQQSRKSPPA